MTPTSLFEAERSGKGFACGVAAVAAVLWAAKELGAQQVEILHHSTSGDETGDHASVVGYGAAAVLCPGGHKRRMSFSQLVFILILIALNAFFVGVEFSVVASRRSRLDLLAEPDSRGIKLIHQWLEDDSARDRLIAASQLGITLVSLALGAAGENAFEAMLEPYFEQITLPATLNFLQGLLTALPLIISLTVVTAFTWFWANRCPRLPCCVDQSGLRSSRRRSCMYLSASSAVLSSCSIGQRG